MDKGDFMEIGGQFLLVLNLRELSCQIQVTCLPPCLSQLCRQRGHYIYGGKAEKPQKSGGKPEKGKKPAENWKKKYAGNRKMTFLSHRKPEKWKISAENGKLFLKIAETGKLS